MKIELLRDYRGIKIDDKLMLAGVYDVNDTLGAYLLKKGVAREAVDSTPVTGVEPEPATGWEHNEAVSALGLPDHLQVDEPATDDKLEGKSEKPEKPETPAAKTAGNKGDKKV